MTIDPAERADELLIDDYAAGDALAFRALVERHHDPLICFLFRMMGDRQAAEDVFQETFLQIHQSFDTFDRTRRFKPWLFTIAANKARDALRKIGRRQMLSLSSSVDDDGGASFVDLMEIDIPAPSNDLERREQSDLVQHAIDGMTPKLKEILLLAYFQKLTYVQIAEATKIPLGTVKSRLHSAVAMFAKKWQEQLEESRAKRKAAGAGGED
ncbi:MAG TPA: sigma-70 family RNA polymerase sigma factor [Phycisphaerales bacterium]|nr:sigma-70 family RNA polymerase sigma factor [Phycisphaerales bacterium]